jgi:hypothetical protein
MKPFYFYTRVTQVELLGRAAADVKELLTGLEGVPSTSIYHHTHRYLEQHRYFSPAHPNDFSYWITNALGMKALGEEVASIDILQFQDIEELRQEIIGVLKCCLAKKMVLRKCLSGEEFRFLSSRIFVFPTPFVANGLEEFIGALEKVTIHSLYFHMFEARMRLKKNDNDFSHWLRDLGYFALAEKVSCLDPYTYTLEGLRNKIINLVKTEIK